MDDFANDKKAELRKYLTDVVKRNETDEKLDELAGKMSAEWKKPKQSRKKPDLSFAKFQEKLKKKKS
ncbi:hypothetical protein [Dyadobacter luticola]|nr:hypothetical protein [Dyadobacter luticola]